jgi:hypothetical protein
MMRDISGAPSGDPPVKADQKYDNHQGWEEASDNSDKTGVRLTCWNKGDGISHTDEIGKL